MIRRRWVLVVLLLGAAEPQLGACRSANFTYLGFIEHHARGASVSEQTALPVKEPDGIFIDSSISTDGPRGTISGRVTAENGAGIAYVMIAYFKDGAPDGVPWATFSSDAHGAFEIRNASSGSYTILALLAGYWMSTVSGIIVHDGGHVEGVGIVMNPLESEQ